MDKIVCLGRNYHEHAKEMGERPLERPLLFLKPASVLLAASERQVLSAPLDLSVGEVHHELEIVLKLKRGGNHLDCIEGVTLGLDLTKRDLQKELKNKGHPWTVAKVFPGSAIIGPWLPARVLHEWRDRPFSLKINGVLKQKGYVTEMMMSPLECLEYINGFFPLLPGDLIFTGTPAGVGPLSKDDWADLAWGDFHYRVHWNS